RRAIAVALEDGGADPVQERAERFYEVIAPSLAQYVQQSQPADWRNADRFQAFRGLVQSFLGDGAGNALADSSLVIFQSWLRRDADGRWGPHYDNQRLLGGGEDAWNPGAGYRLPLLHQSWRRVHPIITYRKLHVPMLIIDPTGDDTPPGASFSPQYERLRASHPALIEHVKYPDTGHVAHPQRPDWFVRDMSSLLQRVRKAGSDSCLKAAEAHS
ncbi:alpha/beta fold hydrolase, partial [Steroidobacter sp.]|uniref:alpha/beta fold hydrolase n=1 Tax=Steroidobacter sp. TaxID=1978227 RepID=UPI001A42054C